MKVPIHAVILLLALSSPTYAKERLTAGHLSTKISPSFQVTLYNVEVLEAPSPLNIKANGFIGFGPKGSGDSLNITFPKNRKNITFECDLGNKDMIIDVIHKKFDGSFTDRARADVTSFPDRANPTALWKFVVKKSVYGLETRVFISSADGNVRRWDFRFCDIS